MSLNNENLTVKIMKNIFILLFCGVINTWYASKHN